VVEVVELVKTSQRTIHGLSGSGLSKPFESAAAIANGTLTCNSGWPTRERVSIDPAIVGDRYDQSRQSVRRLGRSEINVDIVT
jgi:hypothetical protein